MQRSGSGSIAYRLKGKLATSSFETGVEADENIVGASPDGHIPTVYAASGYRDS